MKKDALSRLDLFLPEAAAIEDPHGRLQNGNRVGDTEGGKLMHKAPGDLNTAITSDRGIIIA